MAPSMWQYWREIAQSREAMLRECARISFDLDTPASLPAPASQNIMSPAATEAADLPVAKAQIDAVLSHPVMAIGDQAFCLLDTAGHIRYVSANWQERLPFFHPNEARPLSAFIPESQLSLWQDRLKAAPELSEPETTQDFRIQFGRSMEAMRWFAAKAFAVGEVENRQGYLLALRDIEEEVQREKELRNAQIQAELALKGRSEFLSHMSHELRTPLNAILGFAEMMERGVLGKIENQTYCDYIANIRESGHVLLHKINDLIAISSIETGDLAMKEEAFAASELVEYVMDLHAHRAFSRDVGIMPEKFDEEVTLLGDRTLLAKALANIVLNAVIFSPPGASVDIRHHTSENGMFALAVIDRGAGIDLEHLLALRQMLNGEGKLLMGDPSDRQIGLGLALAKEYVTMHDGQIVIDSTRGEGTLVKIVLPKARVRPKVGLIKQQKSPRKLILG